MRVHMKGGTPMSGPSLCGTCTLGHISKGYRQNEQIVVCKAVYFHRTVPFPVQECSSYVDRNRQDFYEMEKIAWVITPSSPKRKTGFGSGGDTEVREVELILEDEM